MFQQNRKRFFSQCSQRSQWDFLSCFFISFFKRSSASSPLTSDLHLKTSNQWRESVNKDYKQLIGPFQYKQPPQGVPLLQNQMCVKMEEQQEVEEEEEGRGGVESESTAGPIGGGGGFSVFLQVVTES